MRRDPRSHKGENGKTAIVGGSAAIHGAPLLAGRAAEASGTDLLFLCVPRCHADVAKATSLNFQVHPFRGDELSPSDAEHILEILATMDTAVIGPGLHRGEATLRAVEEVVTGASCLLVLDATALQPDTLSLLRGKTAVVTPHLGELERMGIAPERIGRVAKESGVTILLKGHADRIATPDGKVTEVTGGNAGLTVGGTGDALAGCIAGLLAQGMAPAEACVLASQVIKGAGDALLPEYGYAYTASDVIERIPLVLAEHSPPA